MDGQDDAGLGIVDPEGEVITGPPLPSDPVGPTSAVRQCRLNPWRTTWVNSWGGVPGSLVRRHLPLGSSRLGPALRLLDSCPYRGFTGLAKREIALPHRGGAGDGIVALRRRGPSAL